MRAQLVVPILATLATPN